MTKTCLKCGKTFNEKDIDDPAADKFPSCPECWDEWKRILSRSHKQKLLMKSKPMS
jgi:hypothetical protein